MLADMYVSEFLINHRMYFDFICLFLFKIHRRVIESFEDDNKAMQQNGVPSTSHQVIPFVSLRNN